MSALFPGTYLPAHRRVPDEMSIGRCLECLSS